MSMFSVGQLVRCVSRNPEWDEWPEFSFPYVGMVYTVRDTEPSYLGEVGPCLRVMEIENRLAACGREPNFFQFRFVPVKDTSIEIFRSLLSPVPEEVA